MPTNETKCPECELEGYAYGVGPLQHRRPCGSLVTICSGVTQVTQSEACKTIQALKSDNEAKDLAIAGLKERTCEGCDHDSGWVEKVCEGCNRFGEDKYVKTNPTTGES